jgi:hypothetical protein
VLGEEVEEASSRTPVTETVKEPSQSFLRDLAFTVAVGHCGR